MMRPATPDPTRPLRRARRALAPLGLLALALLLGACTVTIQPGSTTVRGRIGIGIDLNEIIAEFRPTRGEGASYAVNEQIAFRIRTRQSGYVTLTALDPDGAIYAFARNIYVPAGQTTTIRGTAPGNRFFTTGPRGQHFVRASFTPAPTSGIVVYGRNSGRDAWNRSIESEIRQQDVRDVAQTSYYVY